MNKKSNAILLLGGCVFVAIIVAFTYFLFEYAVHHSINFVWNMVFDTENVRILVLPLCLVGALIFYGFQHVLDPKSQNSEKHGLGGGSIDPSIKTLLIILLLGYFSLLGGASLGPEAILVPSSIVIGAFIGVKLAKGNTKAPKAFAAAGIMALMAAFFHSFVIGILSVFLVKKQTGVKISPQLVVIAVVSSVTSYLTLKIIDPTNKYFHFPDFNWKIAIIDLSVGIALVIGGYLATFGLKYSHTLFVRARKNVNTKQWWQLALLSGSVLGILYLLGGPLVEFTGNESIQPMLAQASELGTFGLLVVLLVKILAIGWSKAMGYRGGLIFPMVFVASTLVAVAQLWFNDLSFGIGLIATMIGVLAAEKKAEILL